VTQFRHSHARLAADFDKICRFCAAALHGCAERVSLVSHQHGAANRAFTRRAVTRQQDLERR